MRVLFAGSPEVALPTLIELAKDHEIVAVLTQPPRPRGRKSAPQPTAVADYAKQQGWQVLAPQHVADAADEIKRLSPEIAVVVAYGQLLPRELLSLPGYGWLNLHFSLLPLWRGAAPVQHAIIAGDEVTGASVFRLEPGMDTGPILGQITTAISPSETAGQLLERLAIEGARLMRAVVEGVAAGQLQATPQVASDATYAPKLLAADGRINWQASAIAVSRQVRGCTPQPGAWTAYNGTKLELHEVELVDEPVDLAPAQLLIGKSAVLVGTGSLPVRLGEVKPAGRNWMAAADWARGLATFPVSFE